MIFLFITEQKEIIDFVEDQLKKGYIYPSKSPQISLVFFIPNKDGFKYMVQDYCYLNEHTIKDKYVPPPFNFSYY